MSSQDFFWISLGVSLILLLSFLGGRKGYMPPSKLDLKKKISDGSSSNSGSANSSPANSKVQGLILSESLAEKNLNVIFMFNGHSFDAYEVLGLPAGSRAPAVEAAYIKLKESVDPQQAEFIEAAYLAIRRSRIT